jgi:hypothetical protein
MMSWQQVEEINKKQLTTKQAIKQSKLHFLTTRLLDYLRLKESVQRKFVFSKESIAVNKNWTKLTNLKLLTIEIMSQIWTSYYDAYTGTSYLMHPTALE